MSWINKFPRHCAGFLVDLISPSVTSGFTAATAVIIVVSQLKGLLGLSFVAESPFDNIRLIVRHWPGVRLGDCALALMCCAVLLALRVSATALQTLAKLKRHLSFRSSSLYMTFAIVVRLAVDELELKAWKISQTFLFS